MFTIPSGDARNPPAPVLKDEGVRRPGRRPGHTVRKNGPCLLKRAARSVRAIDDRVTDTAVWKGAGASNRLPTCDPLPHYVRCGRAQTPIFRRVDAIGS
jgi:hypothetical protein